MSNLPSPLARPSAGEYFSYYGRYIDLVPEGYLLAHLERQIDLVADALNEVDPAIANRRPAAGEWSALDIGVHLADAERILAFRAFTFARHEGTELPGVEFEDYAETAGANARTIADVVVELRAVRAATLALFRSFSAHQWTQVGTASGSTISVRALAYVIAGHDLHHLPDIERLGRGCR